MLSAALIDPLIDAALREDLAGGDLTSECCVEPATPARAEAVARTELVVCGGELFSRVFQRLDPATEVDRLRPDGALAQAGTALWRALRYCLTHVCERLLQHGRKVSAES